MGEQKTTASSVNRAKTYQLVLFPLNNGATNVYYVLVLSYIATFGSKVLALSMLFASVMVTGMRLFDAVTDPIIGALMDRTNGRFGKFRPFMVIGNLIMAASILVLYCLTPLIPASAMGLRYAAFVALYAVWVIGYTFQTSCTRSGQTVLTNDPKQRPLFTIFNTVGSLLGMGAMQFFAPILAKNYEGGYSHRHEGLHPDQCQDEGDPGGQCLPPRCSGQGHEAGRGHGQVADHGSAADGIPELRPCAKHLSFLLQAAIEAPESPPAMIGGVLPTLTDSQKKLYDKIAALA